MDQAEHTDQGHRKSGNPARSKLLQNGSALPRHADRRCCPLAMAQPSERYSTFDDLLNLVVFYIHLDYCAQVLLTSGSRFVQGSGKFPA